MKTAALLLTAALLAPATTFAADDANVEACYNYFNGQDYENAIISGKKAINSSPKRTESHVCLGAAYLQVGRAKEALAELTVAESLAKDKEEISVVSSHLGIVYRRLGDNNKALQYYNRQLTLCRELGITAGISTALSNIADLYMAEGDYQKAASYFIEALKLNPDDPITLSNLAVLLAHMRQFDQAEKVMLKAIKNAELAGDYHAVGRSLIELGGIRYALEDYKSAEAALFAGLEKVHAIGDVLWEGVAFQKLGWVYAKVGMKRKSMESLQRAIALFKAVGASSSVESAERDLKEVKQEVI